jgi:pimeloyl-ACP methyl ester carboxylesterase
MSRLKVNDIEIFYEVHGHYEHIPLIFLHGWTKSSYLWESQVEYFKSRKKIITLDLRGHGQSDKPLNNYSIKQFSEDLYMFMKKLGIEKAVIIGHSMGGMIGLRFAIDHQEMTEKLVLVSTLAKFLFSFGRKLAYSMSERFSAESIVNQYYSRAYQKGYPSSEIEKAVKKALQTPEHVVLSCLEGMKKFDVSSELSSIQVPTLIIHGKNDATFPLSQANYLKNSIPNSELTVIEGAGHEIIDETPEKISQTIEKFLLRR